MNYRVRCWDVDYTNEEFSDWIFETSSEEEAAESFAIDSEIELNCKVQVLCVDTGVITTYTVKVVKYPNKYKITKIED